MMKMATGSFWVQKKIDESDAVVLSMKEMIKHDGTLYNVPELECGQSAVRENIHHPWRIE